MKDKLNQRRAKLIKDVARQDAFSMRARIELGKIYVELQKIEK